MTTTQTIDQQMEAMENWLISDAKLKRDSIGARCERETIEQNRHMAQWDEPCKILNLLANGAFTTTIPARLKLESITLAGIDLLVARDLNITLDEAGNGKLEGRKSHTQSITGSSYFIALIDGAILKITTADTDEIMSYRITSLPVGHLAEFITKHNAILLDLAFYNEAQAASYAETRAKIAQERIARDEEIRVRNEDRARKAKESQNRELANNTETFRNGGRIDFQGFENLCLAHDVTLHIRTIGTGRKSVSGVSKTGVWIAKGKSTDAIWTAIRELNTKLAAR